ncbi:hypothetical protein TELCIR_07059, partial [Teladorsagia circumcincta]
YIDELVGQILPDTPCIRLSMKSVQNSDAYLCYATARGRTRAVTTYFIINLAFADLLTGIFAIPFKFQAALFQCRPVYADDNWWKIYNVYLTIIHYFVPMIILDTAYTMIAIKIWGSTVNGSEESSSNQANLNTEISNRKNKYKREYRRVFNCLRCRADDVTEGEPQKFDTEYPAGGLYKVNDNDTRVKEWVRGLAKKAKDESLSPSPTSIGANLKLWQARPFDNVENLNETLVHLLEKMFEKNGEEVRRIKPGTTFGCGGFYNTMDENDHIMQVACLYNLTYGA